MGGAIHQSTASAAWKLARSQHGVIGRRQLLDLGFNSRSIEHRIRRGRLHPIWPGVYAVGRRAVTFEGRWMAAVLVGGPGAVLSHLSAAMLWGIVSISRGPAHLSLPACTIVDLATTASTLRVERAIDQADILDLMDPEALRQELEQMPPRPGRRAVRRLLDPQFFRLTRSELERPFFRLPGAPDCRSRKPANG